MANTEGIITTETTFRFCDDLGPKTILHIYQATRNLKALVVVDNVAAGPSIGGVRIAPDVSLEECFRLARAMTFKSAAAGLPHGVTEEAETVLHARGVLCLPDFISNAGGVICASVEYHGGTQTQALRTIEEKIRANTVEVLDGSRRHGILPRQAAVAMAGERIRKAMKFRRWG